MQYDFLAIGDVVTDAFIKLRDAEVHKHLRHAEREICIPWGTKMPYDGVVVVPAVGNCANAAVSAARLGLSSALLSNTGGDAYGVEQLETLKKNNIATDFVRVHEEMPSNYHFVLSFKGERTILVKHEPYPYTMPDVGNPKWMYLTSLGELSVDFHHDIEKYLDAHPDINLVFQPGTFQIKLGVETLAGIYKHCKVFFANVEEAQLVTGESSRDIRILAHAIHIYGPEIICITDGPDGAYAFDSKTDELWFMPLFPDPKPPLDRTGAGDAFASTFSVALALGKTVPEALSWAPINSMSVVQYYGAQEGLLSRDALAGYLANAPASYVPKKI